MAYSDDSKDLAFDKVAVSGAILARIMHEFGSCWGDCDGLLFGHMDRTVSSTLGDEDEPIREDLTAIITGFYCSGSLFGFYDGAGCIDPRKLVRITGSRGSRGDDALIGWFTGRRNTSARPSLRETAVAKHLSMLFIRNKEGNQITGSSRDIANAKQLKFGRHVGGTSTASPSQVISASGGISSPINVDIPESPGRVEQTEETTIFSIGKSGDCSSVDTISPRSPHRTSIASLRASSSKDLSPDAKLQGSCPCLFMLFTEFGTQQEMHTHEYRAYYYDVNLAMFTPRGVSIVNIGPAFRGNYGSFSPVVPFPLFSSGKEGEINLQSPGSFIGTRSNQRELRQGRRRTHTSPNREQTLLDVYAEGFKVERLANLVGPSGMHQVHELEELYAKMLLKLENVAKQVCESSSALLEQEKYNTQLKMGCKEFE